jgi:hypothetical protein
LLQNNFLPEVTVKKDRALLTRAFAWCFTTLPPAIIITLPGKMTAIISLLARALVGGNISDAGGRGTGSYRGEWQETVRSKSIDVFWLEGFGPGDNYRIIEAETLYQSYFLI